jgi:hypothetical protein
MSQVSLIKCPHCVKWGQWTGKVDEKCQYCNEYLDPERLQYTTERVQYEENRKKSDFLVVKDSDETIVQIFKIFLTPIRTATYYGVGLIFLVVALMLVVFGLIV